MLRFRFGDRVMGCQVQIQFTLPQKPLGVTLSSREPHNTTLNQCCMGFKNGTKSLPINYKKGFFSFFFSINFVI
jgi:hypothetical protein